MTGSFSKHIRRIILRESKRANVGHIGPALSVADIVAALYEHILSIERPTNLDRDRFILSKGHAALAVYAALCLKGWISGAQLDMYCTDGSLLGVHPERGLPGIDFGSGSLGHGLSVGTGAALAARLQNSRRRVFVLVSDAECNEGALWEAVMFAAHHKLSNLVAIVDQNGQQALGYTKDVLSLEPLAERWRAFGWDTVEADGHNVAALRSALELRPDAGKPRVVVARTVAGKGVSFMENQVKWHYWPMSDSEYRQALAEVEAGPVA
jgi:transketolase